jgi:hypothetical protein
MATPAKPKNRALKYAAIALAIVALCIFSGIAGGVVGKKIGSNNHEVSYSDFISILLSAISLLMTLLGFGLAIFGVIGWNSVSSRVKERTKEFLDTGFDDDGALSERMRSHFGEFLKQGLDEGGELQILFKKEFASMMYGERYGDIPESDDLNEDEG